MKHTRETSLRTERVYGRTGLDALQYSLHEAVPAVVAESSKLELRIGRGAEQLL